MKHICIKKVPIFNAIKFINVAEYEIISMAFFTKHRWKKCTKSIDTWSPTFFQIVLFFLLLVHVKQELYPKKYPTFGNNTFCLYAEDRISELQAGKSNGTLVDFQTGPSYY